MKKSLKILLVLIIILILMVGGYFTYKHFFNKPAETPTEPQVQVTNQIEEYGYTLEDRDTEVFKEKFEELKELLNQEEYDKEQYVSLISELFIIDLYTINNKMSRYDIGGIEYVYSGAVDSLKTVAQNSIYKTVENNVDGSRTQSLPEVTSITVDSVGDYTYTMPDNSTVEGYKVVLSWEYKEDLGYDDNGTLLLIPDENKYGVVYFN